MAFRRWKTDCAAAPPAAGGKHKTRKGKGKKAKRITRSRR